MMMSHAITLDRFVSVRQTTFRCKINTRDVVWNLNLYQYACVFVFMVFSFLHKRAPTATTFLGSMHKVVVFLVAAGNDILKVFRIRVRLRLRMSYSLLISITH